MANTTRGSSKRAATDLVISRRMLFLDRVPEEVGILVPSYLAPNLQKREPKCQGRVPKRKCDLPHLPFMCLSPPKSPELTFRMPAFQPLRFRSSSSSSTSGSSFSSSHSSRKSSVREPRGTPSSTSLSPSLLMVRAVLPSDCNAVAVLSVAATLAGEAAPLLPAALPRRPRRRMAVAGVAAGAVATGLALRTLPGMTSGSSSPSSRTLRLPRRLLPGCGDASARVVSSPPTDAGLAAPRAPRRRPAVVLALAGVAIVVAGAGAGEFVAEPRVLRPPLAGAASCVDDAAGGLPRPLPRPLPRLGLVNR